MKTLQLSSFLFMALIVQAVAQDTMTGTFKIRSADDNNEYSDQVFTIVEVMPEFPGGQTALLQYINSIGYPAKAKEDDIQGIVYVRFIISELGAVSRIEIARGAHPLLDEAVLAHVRKMPAWKPGKQNNKPVKVQFVLPVKFSLD